MSQSIRSNRRRGKAFTYLLLAIGSGFVVVPFWFMVATSLKPQAYIFDIPPSLIPREVTTDNYTEALGKDLFGVYFLNSMVVALSTVVLTLVLSSLLAYGFARLEFPAKEKIFYLLLLGMMVPPVMLIIPQFLIAKNLNLLDSLAGLVAVYIAMNVSMQTFLLRGFFESIPRDLEDAALIDGASRWTIMWRIIIPLSRPGLAVVAIFTFLYAWDEFPWAHVAIRETTKRTLPIGIALFQSQHLTQWGQVFAASIVALIPVVVVFAIFQRYFVRGISTTGLKG